MKNFIDPCCEIALLYFSSKERNNRKIKCNCHNGINTRYGIKNKLYNGELNTLALVFTSVDI